MLKNSSTSGLNYLKWQNLTGATRKCTWSRGVVATFSWMRTYSQNSKNPSSVTGKSSIYRKGGTVETNCWNTDVRAANGLQRGNTTEGTLQSHPKLRSVGTQRKPLLFLEPFTSYFSLRNGKKVSYREWSCTKDSRCNHPFLLKWKANSSTCFFQGLMMHRGAMFNHHASWGGIIKHLKRSF